MDDPRIVAYRDAALEMAKGHFNVEIPVPTDGAVSELGRALLQLAKTLELSFQQARKLLDLTAQVNAGLLVDEVLNNVFESFRPTIPYNRIGLALLDDELRTVTARWCRSDAPTIELGGGYSAPLQGSSLQKIIDTGRPRILNDLQQYLSEHPESESTRKIVDEGMRSSLTCPLIAMAKPIGFMFFTSMQPNTYNDVHIGLYMEIAGQLAIIIEKSRLYEELAEANRKTHEAIVELQRSNRDLDQFASVISHDLHAPLRGVIGLAELLHDQCQGKVDREAEENLELVVQSARRMQRLIEDLRAYSRLTAKTKPHAPISCETVFGDAVANLKVQIEEARATITHDPLPTVAGDATQLMQLLQNLIGNAIKYRAEKSPEIHVSAAQTDGEWQFCVRDNGIGIAPDQHEKIFKIFQRVHSTEDQYAGTGIGLAVCKRVVERHGGRIWIESEPGQGSAFYFTLSARQST